MTDQESQEDELLALASIYDPDTFFIEEGEIPSGHFAAQLNLSQAFCVSFADSDGCKKYEVEYLPPVMLYYSLPANYPSVSPPQYTLACKWLKLTQLSRICQRLDEIWSENQGEVILFLWTNFLTEELVDFLGITSPLELSDVVESKSSSNHFTLQPVAPQSTDRSNDYKISPSEGARSSDSKASPSEGAVGFNVDSDSGIFDTTPCDLEASGQGEAGTGASSILCDKPPGSIVCDPRAVQDIAEQKLLRHAVLEHDRAHKEFVFKKTLFTCHVCCLEKLGELCIKYHGCGHVFCKDCMAGYFRVMIKDGNVKGLTCPADKCDTQAHPAQVSELVDKELFLRYERLLLQCSLDTMTDIMYCPRKNCNNAVIVDVEHNMGMCQVCDFVFCVFCKFTYHGVSPCKLKPDEVKKLRVEYENSSAEQKRLMEQRYGKKVIERAIHDSYTSEWLEEFSKQCPHCKSHIQKIDGCNKMTCGKCHAYFCWLCNATLPRANPYSHFNALGSQCFNRLFQGLTADGDDDEFLLLQFW